MRAVFGHLWPDVTKCHIPIFAKLSFNSQELYSLGSFTFVVLKVQSTLIFVGDKFAQITAMVAAR